VPSAGIERTDKVLFIDARVFRQIDRASGKWLPTNQQVLGERARLHQGETGDSQTRQGSSGETSQTEAAWMFRGWCARRGLADRSKEQDGV